MAQINISLLGAGYWGSKIAKQLEVLTHVNKVEIVDIKDGKTIDDVQYKNVIVATPAWDHYDQTCKLLERGHNLYVEKPLALTRHECDEIKSRIDAQILLVGHIFLYNERVQKIKELIDSGKIGEVQYIESTRQNWGRFQTRISTLLSLAPHDVSIIHYLLGYEPFTDIAYKGINLSGKTQNDIDTYQFKCKGVDIKFNLSWYHPAKIRTMSIIGTKGMIYWDEEAHSLVHYDKLWENDRMNYDTITHPHRYNIQTNPLRNQLKDFVHCIEDSSQPLSNVDVAIEVASNLDLLNQYSS